ncbi:hypothetical protein AAFC00_006467 [Neodothiora populina]|uniref:Uncharacterized protein n=1 Tax=Neodothiora populina TaxID=2781224 RepID=A0ABR3P5B6_9PEZI
MAIRTLIGMVATLLSTLSNILTMTVIVAERAWMCLLFCNFNVVVCILSLYYITHKSNGTGTRHIARNVPLKSTPGSMPKSQPAVSVAATSFYSNFAHPDDLPGLLPDYASSSGNMPTMTTSCTADHASRKTVPNGGIEALREVEIHSDLADDVVTSPKIP